MVGDGGGRGQGRTSAGRSPAFALDHKAIVSNRLIISPTEAAPANHASTIVELNGGGLLAAWFAGEKEGASGVSIQVVSWDPDTEIWSSPEVVASDPVYPCWNPVLYQNAHGEVQLYYKVGPSPREWVGFVKRSTDEGRSWGPVEALPKGFLGPIKNKPIELSDGTLLSPTSLEEADYRWTCWIESSQDQGKTWEKRYGPIDFNGRIIQPTIWEGRDGEVRMLARSRAFKVIMAKSTEHGTKWGEPFATDVPNPNAGVDAVALPDGRVLLVYNPSKIRGFKGRGAMAVALSEDDGDSWSKVFTLEDTPEGEAVCEHLDSDRLLSGCHEYSYPSIIVASNGLVHITYTYDRSNVKHVVLDPAKLVPEKADE